MAINLRTRSLKQSMRNSQDRGPKDRERVAREIGDHLFEEFSTIPLISIFSEVAVNPKVVADWLYPVQGPEGRHIFIS